MGCLTYAFCLEEFRTHKVNLANGFFTQFRDVCGMNVFCLFQSSANEDGSVTLNMLLGSEREFKLWCPAGA